MWGVVVRTAEVGKGLERQDSATELGARHPEGRGCPGSAEAQSGACNLGGPRPFTSPHPAWLFIASCSLKTHLLMFLGQMNVENQT